MSNETQNRVITQANGEQAATSYGPRLRNVGSPSKHGNQDFLRTIEVQFNGDIQTEQLYDATNETQWAFPDNCFIMDAYVYSDTGLAALVVEVEDSNGNALPVASVTPSAGNWSAVRDIGIRVRNTSQLTYSGVAAGETGTMYLTFLQTATDAGEDGVLVKPRVQPV